jgi:hypothetical protein
MEIVLIALQIYFILPNAAIFCARLHWEMEAENQSSSLGAML